MKLRIVAIAAAGLLALGLAGVTAAPWVATRYAEGEIDRTLSQVRKRSTAVASRGAVKVDIASRTVAVRDIAVDTPGEDGVKVRVGRTTVERPGKRDGRVTADRVRFEDIVLTIGPEVVTIPTIEVVGYDGPAEGLVGTPGAGKAARTQADILGQVSIANARIPSVEVRNATLQAVRTVTNVALGRMTDGIVTRATVDGVRIEVGRMPSGEAAAIGLRAGAIVYEGLSLPAALRFYADDGEGERERAVARASVSDVVFEAPSERFGQIEVKVGRIEAEDVGLRALASPAETIAAVEARIRRGEPPTPAEMRRQILLVTDSVRAFAFGRIAATAVAFEARPPGRPPLTGEAASVELAGYADGKLDRFDLKGARISSSRGEARLAEASVARADASGLLAYAERVGRDQTLLTGAPPPEEMLKLVPRVGGVRVAGVALETPLGQASVGAVRSGARGDVEAVPNRIGLAIENFSAPAPQNRWFSRYLRDAGLDRIDLSFRLVMSFDPTTKRLTLEGLDYASPEIGDVKLTGALAGVDPELVIASGGDMVAKLSEVTLEPFKLRVVDRGGVAAAFAAAARAEGAAPEPYGEAFAQDAEAQLTSVLGPSARASGTALGLFLRKGGTLEATIAPRAPDTKLLELLGALKLGPEGIAQTLDLEIVTRAE